MSEKAWQVGRIFTIKLDGGEVVETECVHWDCERREFKLTDGRGFVDMDWMEYTDQASLGRINLVGTPEGDGIALELF